MTAMLAIHLKAFNASVSPQEGLAKASGGIRLKPVRQTGPQRSVVSLAFRSFFDAV